MTSTAFTRQAAQTEYKGIVYRSKCEAMFARFLELDIYDRQYLRSNEGPFFSGNTFNYQSGGFVYEPNGLDVDGWTPDFLQWCIELYPNADVPYLIYTIIEYKPSKPTQTYIKRFAKRCLLVRDRMLRNGIRDSQINLRLYFGSVFNESRSLVSVNGETGDVTIEEDYDWLANYEEDIKETRFDLCQ